MSTKKILFDFLAIFSITLVSAILSTFLYSLIVHGTGMVDWETSFRLAFILGIVLSFANERKRKEDKKMRF